LGAPQRRHRGRRRPTRGPAPGAGVTPRPRPVARDLLFLSSVVAIHSTEKGGTAMATDISRQELQSMMDRREKFTLVEALQPHAYRQGHLPGAINLPPDEVRQRAPDLLPDKNA